jgi:hypothetical protein
MKKEEGREASYRGDRCLLNFLCGRRLFFSVFLFPVCKARLIGDWLENRRSAPNCSVRLFSFFFLPTQNPNISVYFFSVSQ